ncbi:lytic murein transglycosylase [Pseudomonas sp. TTU2014-080ASC]|uniref:lytic murein transglycosylase n=1 Tax=Pseudomonas sp. TTU2014-080ASC TaxID=1729724 RepID=UPI0007184964|nr:lytic murein transglycosylase [Pseudomonas sp. TTU2014-080ASC]KRW57509.1 murein transglycosylase [Pseudomonas sp. TTU2014-080ASC]
MPDLLIRGLYHSATACTLMLLIACAEAPAQTYAAPVTAPVPSPAATTTPVAFEAPAPLLTFEEWRSLLRSDAIAAGINAQLFDRTFAGITPDPKVIAADRSQPEFTRPVWEYIDGAVSVARVAQGRVLKTQHRPTLKAIRSAYRVDHEVLIAIWGMESNFGSNIGNSNVIRSLATLAFEGRRQAFWRGQLLAALQIMQAGDYHGKTLIGSWAGAMGQTQFMPTTFNEHAVDFDGDGRRDLWGSIPDALASAAHYLSKSGWINGESWGVEVTLPKNFDYDLADPEIRRSMAQWRELGVRPVREIRATDESQATLFLPAGYRGPAFLLLNNFRVILRYNNSTAYALAIGLLSDALDGEPGVQAAWPRGDRQLGRSERIEIQQLLTAKGFDTGPADGIIGANTRKAVRAFQHTQNLPADGYPSYELLQALRRL